MTQPIPAGLAAPARATLGAWHAMLESGDLDALDMLFAEDVVFRSPVAHTPYPGRNAAALVLRTVVTVFEAFRYHRSFATDDGASVVLEFSAAVAGKSLKGIDMIRFDADGKIIEFEVMVRPATGLQALGAAMGAKLGDQARPAQDRCLSAPAPLPRFHRSQRRLVPCHCRRSCRTACPCPWWARRCSSSPIRIS